MSRCSAGPRREREGRARRGQCDGQEDGRDSRPARGDHDRPHPRRDRADRARLERPQDVVAAGPEHEHERHRPDRPRQRRLAPHDEEDDRGHDHVQEERHGEVRPVRHRPDRPDQHPVERDEGHAQVLVVRLEQSVERQVALEDERVLVVVEGHVLAEPDEHGQRNHDDADHDGDGGPARPGAFIRGRVGVRGRHGPRVYGRFAPDPSTTRRSLSGHGSARDRTVPSVVSQHGCRRPRSRSLRVGAKGVQSEDGGCHSEPVARGDGRRPEVGPAVDRGATRLGPDRRPCAARGRAGDPASVEPRPADAAGAHALATAGARVLPRRDPGRASAHRAERPFALDVGDPSAVRPLLPRSAHVHPRAHGRWRAGPRDRASAALREARFQSRPVPAELCRRRHRHRAHGPAGHRVRRPRMARRLPCDRSGLCGRDRRHRRRHLTRRKPAGVPPDPRDAAHRPDDLSRERKPRPHRDHRSRIPAGRSDPVRRPGHRRLRRLSVVRRAAAAEGRPRDAVRVDAHPAAEPAGGPGRRRAAAPRPHHVPSGHRRTHAAART